MKYSAYIEFRDGKNQDRAMARLVRALVAAKISPTEISIAPVTGGSPMSYNGSVTLQEYLDGLDSVGEDNIPDDPFQFPHIRQLMNHLDQRYKDGLAIDEPPC